MRNILIIIGVAVFMLLMVACNDSQAEGDSLPEEDNVEEPTDEENNDNEEPDKTEENNDDKSESNEENKEDEEQKESQESQEEENQKPQYYMNENGFFKPIDDADSKVVLLTIDDAPDGHTLEMAETLKEYDAPAIFFVNGHFMDTEEEKEIVRKIHDMGFYIGNHTYSHVNLREVSKEEQKEEILKLNGIIEEVIGAKPTYFRPPFGANTDYARDFVKDQGMYWMNWSFGYDYFNDYMEADALEEIMLTTNLLVDGANILMHDREWTNEALPNILEGYQEQGFDFLDPALIITDE
ncbi:polysaccharide deacetylase family protein [Aquisalibacillus elongatus]|uniref:Peptidoglycan/xylan/chitin deacetylase (PgdA/CDA1 family) n=1 Tax=Aquisalibacillus elongatus TaxID=485577 RepID=A0A3N5BHB1_9BACI|nr:polysaccharide deacetylase family protein [Aquisalibacillus elongatus]RPF56139.1 peptidoglycan/xylan/chitin deacetylase (PgdA/CDA1 family) [Aquisalibacillus elongatus]